MRSFFKLLAVSTLTFALTVSFAQANVMKVGLASLSEVFAYLKSGVSIAAKEVSVKDFNVRAQTRLIYMFGKTSSSEYIVAVTRADGPAMIQMNIELIQPLNAVAKKLADEIPNSYRMNGEVTDAVTTALRQTEVNSVGQRALQNIEKLDGLAIHESSIGNLAFDLERSGKQLRVATFSERSGIRLVDDINNTGAGASFNIQVGLPKSATPEQVQALLDAVTAAM